MNEAVKEAALLPVRLERQVGGWISVEDSLPEWAGRDDTPCFIEGKEIGATLTSEKVLVAISPNNVVRIDNTVSIEGTELSWFDTYGKRVTHWMPLPKAPNAELRGGPAVSSPERPA